MDGGMHGADACCLRRSTRQACHRRGRRRLSTTPIPILGSKTARQCGAADVALHAAALSTSLPSPLVESCQNALRVI
jgi:hypothetical protein